MMPAGVYAGELPALDGLHPAERRYREAHADALLAFHVLGDAEDDRDAALRRERAQGTPRARLLAAFGTDRPLQRGRA